MATRSPKPVHIVYEYVPDHLTDCKLNEVYHLLFNEIKEQIQNELSISPNVNEYNKPSAKNSAGYPSKS